MLNHNASCLGCESYCIASVVAAYVSLMHAIVDGVSRYVSCRPHTRDAQPQSPVSTLDQIIGSESEVGPPGAALLLPTAPHGWVKCREHMSLYAVYVTNKVPLHLCVDLSRNILMYNSST